MFRGVPVKFPLMSTCFTFTLVGFKEDWLILPRHELSVQHHNAQHSTSLSFTFMTGKISPF